MVSILHIDDDQFDLELVRLKLTRVDKEIKISSESNVGTALNRIESEEFDAVLCDFQMPEANGLDVLRKLRDSGRDIPFVFLTGQGNERLAVEALHAGADDYFTKEEGLAHYERLVHSLRRRVFSHRKAREHERLERALDAVLAETQSKTDRNFLDALLLKLTEVLGIAYAIVGEFDGDEGNTIRTISLVSHGRVGENIEYCLTGTPCENVVAKEPCVYDSGVQAFLPDDTLLVEMKAESYIGVPLFSGGGSPLGLIAMIDDKPMVRTSLTRSLLLALSSRVSAEIERMSIMWDLAESERQLRSVINSMFSGFALHEIICDEKGKPVDYRFLKVNPAFEKLTGLKAAEVIGESVCEVIPDLSPFWIDTYGRVALTGEPTCFANIGKELDRHYEVRVYSPGPGLFATIFNDITEQVAAVKALRRSESRYRSLVELNVAGIFRGTADGRLLECNDAMLEIIGYSSFDEIKDINLREFYVDLSQREKLINDLRTFGIVKNHVVDVKVANGKPIKCLLNIQLIDDEYIFGTVIAVGESSLNQF